MLQEEPKAGLPPGAHLEALDDVRQAVRVHRDPDPREALVRRVPEPVLVQRADGGVRAAQHPGRAVPLDAVPAQRGCTSKFKKKASRQCQ